MAKTMTVIDCAMKQRLVKNVINEQYGNLAQRHNQTTGNYRHIAKDLSDFARLAGHLAIKHGRVSPMPDEKDWQKNYANAIEKEMYRNGLRSLVDMTMNKFAKKYPMVMSGRSRVEYSFFKVAQYTGLVANMILHGFNTELLVCSHEDKQKMLLKKIKSFHTQNIPHMVVVL